MTSQGQQTTFEYLTDILKTKTRPKNPIITVHRNKSTSRYQYYLLARAYAKKVGAKPRFFTFERQKSFADQIKGIIEEHSVFNQLECRLFVLEGFYNSWVQQLFPAPNTYIVAETDNGDLKPVDFTQRAIRDHLRIILDLCDYRRPDLTLRDLVKLDWSSTQSFEEIESLMNRVHALGWNAEQMETELLSRSEWNNALTVLKRGKTDEILNFMTRINTTWFYNRVIKNLSDLIHYRALRTMGHAHEAAVKSMDLHPRSARARDLEAVNDMYTYEDVQLIAQRLVDFDFLIMKNVDLGVELMALNAPTRLRK